MKQVEQALSNLRVQDRYRSCVQKPSAHGIDLASNDSLGFSTHHKLQEAAIRFFQENGAAGAGASRLLRGHHETHHALEDYAASYFKAERSLYFSSGFQANHALLSTLPTRHDIILFDALIHASSRTGIQASQAKHKRVEHNDLEAYEEALKATHKTTKGQIWIVIESLYSMEGDFTPLEALYDLAERYDAMLIIDEAHAVGIYGSTGKGCTEELIAAKGYERIIAMHTCGKALGVAGGLICASAPVVEYLINTARGFIYSTAPMPIQPYLVQCALELLQSPDAQDRRTHLKALCTIAQDIWGGAGSHIIPIIIGEDAKAVEVARDLQEQGFDIHAIRPPTVPEGTARLRLSLNFTLTEEILKDVAGILERL